MEKNTQAIDLEYTLNLIKTEDQVIDSKDFYQFLGQGKLIIFSKAISETQLQALFSLFVGIIKEVEKYTPGYTDFLISRSYLYPSIFEDTVTTDIQTAFILVETEMNNMYLCRSTSPNTKDLFRLFASMTKLVKKSEDK